MNCRGLVCFICGAILLVPVRDVAQASEAFIGSHEPGASAVDAKGMRHTESAHSRGLAPWMQDRVKSIAPYYPYEDRRLHHTGIGLFRLYLDLKTGFVREVTVLKSTGFATLDNAAITTFRGWRWRPSLWKEIDIPVNYTLSHGSPTPPPADWVRLPPH